MIHKTVKVKPVQASEIKDPNIVRAVIAEIRRKPTAEDLAYLQKLETTIERLKAK